MAFRGTFDYSLDAKNRLTVPAKQRELLAEGLVLARGMDTCVELWPAEDYDRRMKDALNGLHPMSTEARRIKSFYGGNAHDGKLDGAGRVGLPPTLMEYADLQKDVVVVGAEDCLQIWNKGAWKAFNDRLAAEMNEIADRLAMLVDMAPTHVPVLAAELIDVLAPQAGETAVDCTFGAGGHARLIAEKLGPEGTLIAIDRDPVAEEHFAELAAELPCDTRFLHAPFAEGLAQLHQEGLRADLVYLDLGMSSMQVDTRERGFSYAYDAPLDMRMDPDQELDARTLVNEWDERQIARVLRELGEERFAGQIARAIGRRRRNEAIETTGQLVELISDAIPAPARFAGGHPAKRTFQAIRIAVNDELGQLDSALPLAWTLLRKGARFAGISFHSLEDRRVKRFLADRARGCVCPPDLPVCVCGREPEAELLGRGITPTPGELAANARSKSARLRAARKLTDLPEAT